MKKLAIGLIGLVTAIISVNVLYVGLSAYLGKASDPRNNSVTMVAHLRWGVDPTTLVIDLLDVSETAAMVDVDRSMFDIAESLKSRSFSSVQLAYGGISKFSMSGEYFRQLGEERDFQNPVYTIRTLASNLKDMKGLPAFGTWTGGLLGVVGEQMKDHQTMHRRWYIDAIP